MVKRKELTDRLKLPSVESLDSKQKDYVAKLDEGFRTLVRIYETVEKNLECFTNSILDLTEITPLNEIDLNNSHTHYIVEKEGSLYETCVETIVQILGSGMLPTTIEDNLIELPKISLDELKKQIKSNKRFDNTDSLPANVYLLHNPSKELPLYYLILDVFRKQYYSQTADYVYLEQDPKKDPNLN
ncbi:MAG: hypothetical protein KKA62_02665 [Nanoarchaeota archaeon]|nr:hypothetical protein [Nanoarchaeota archaeon]MBU1644541.1 hypothetical protein [Nanoarchaeota archaeon]MBU1976834.1 hypothetical protein [Nanoarchaeota archaeon]